MTSPPLRVVFFGTPEFAVPSLRALVAGPHDVLAVVTQPDRPAGRRRNLAPPPVKVAALEAGLPVHQPERLKDLRPELEALAPDVAVVVAFGRIFRRWLLELPRHGCMNVHASPLPRLRGAAPIQWSVIRGEPAAGVSIMRLERGVDTGPVCAVRTTPIGDRETAAALAVRLAALGAAALAESLDALRRGEAEFVAQDDALATHAPILTRDDGRIDWRRPAVEVDRLVRGVTPWPGAWTTLGGAAFKVHSTDVLGHLSGPPGEVLEGDGADPDPVVACGEGAVALRRLQPPGRPAMDGRSARNGRYVEVGTRFE